VTPAAKAVLASMTPECREALKQADYGDATSTVAEATRLLGSLTINPEDARWCINMGDGCYEAEAWFGPGCSEERSGPDPLTAALELFKAAHGMVAQ